MATVELYANATADPDLRFAASGKAWVTIRLAENRKDRDGTEVTTWWRAKAFGAQAEQLAEQVRKGTRLKIRGFLELDEWKGNDGEKRVDLVVKPFADGVTVEERRGDVPGFNTDSARRSGNGYAPAGGSQADPWATDTRGQEPPF